MRKNYFVARHNSVAGAVSYSQVYSNKLRRCYHIDRYVYPCKRKFQHIRLSLETTASMCIPTVLNSEAFCVVRIYPREAKSLLHVLRCYHKTKEYCATREHRPAKCLFSSLDFDSSKCLSRAWYRKSLFNIDIQMYLQQLDLERFVVFSQKPGAD